MKLTIKVSKWLRNSNKQQDKDLESMLLDRYGNMCCLGFLGKACGLKKKELLDNAEPSDVIEPKGIFEKLVIPFEDQIGYRNSQIAKDLIEINDDECLNLKDKKKQIKSKMKELGVDVTFVP